MSKPLSSFMCDTGNQLVNNFLKSQLHWGIIMKIHTLKIFYFSLKHKCTFISQSCYVESGPFFECMANNVFLAL